MDPAMTVLAEYDHRHEADLARGLLEDAGIGAVVDADDAGHAYPVMTFTQPARLLVRAADVDRAREVLPD